METYLNYINGEWIHSIRGKTAYSMNPANGENLGAFQDSDPEDMDLAVAAAVEAKLRWRSLSGSTRGNLLFKTANIIEQRLDEIAETMTREMGKTLAEARGETARGVAILRYFAGEGMRKVGVLFLLSMRMLFYILHECRLGLLVSLHHGIFRSRFLFGKWLQDSFTEIPSF
jgi:aldehyde dehydrogenase (NAD+)